MLDGIRFVPTPASEAFLDALRTGSWPTAVQVAEEHWAEVWFSIDPADLRRLLSQVPPEAIAQSANASFLARSTGHGEVEDLLQPEPTAGYGSDLNTLGRVSSDLRLRGRPVQAMSYIRRATQQMRALRGRLMDGTGGFDALALVQGAITALLANEPDAARGLLLQAVTTHRADRFPFVVREATAKLALVLAAEGNVIEARTWAERARRISRSDSWVEDLIDDTLWLTDYLCAIETFDPAAEDLRRSGSSPLQHREFWPIALTANVRHLTLTNRHWQARDLCAAVSAADLPQPGSDGAYATAISDAHLVIADHTSGSVSGNAPSRSSAQAAVSRTLQLFTTGQYQETLTCADRVLAPTYDARHAWALRLLRAQAQCALDPGPQPRRELAQLVEAVLQAQMFSTLRYLTAEAVEHIGDTTAGVRAAELIRVHQIPTVTSKTVLDSPLSAAETAAMRLLQQGLARKEIAQRLFVSVNTVKSQLASAYRKLGARDRVQALRKFNALGL